MRKVVEEVRARKTVVYVSNAESLDIGVFELNRSSGELTAIGRSPIPGAREASPFSMPLAITPDRRLLFAALRSEPFTLVNFGIVRDTGALVYKSTAALPGSMAHIITDRSGRFLLCASTLSHLMSISAIQPDGVVAPPLTVIPSDTNSVDRPVDEGKRGKKDVTDQTIEGRIHAVATDHLNQHLFATDAGRHVILRRRFNAVTGEVSEASVETVVPSRAFPRHFVFHPNNKFLYVLNEWDASIDIFALNESGELRFLDTAHAAPSGLDIEPDAADIHITPSGRFLYASERRSSTIAALSVDEKSGRLALIGHFKTEVEPRSFKIEPTGKFLLAAGQKSNRVTVHSIDPKSGELQTYKSYPMGRNPSWIEIVQLP